MSTEKITGNEPAFPTDNAGTFGGMTLRQYYAGQAPKVPTWFKHIESEKPNKPEHYESLKIDKEGDDYKILMSWHRDPCFDLDEHLKWYQDKWEDYYSKMKEWNEQQRHLRYFQWRTYYADQLISALNNTPVKE